MKLATLLNKVPVETLKKFRFEYVIEDGKIVNVERRK